MILLIDKKSALETAWCEMESIETTATELKKIFTAIGIVGSAAAGGALNGYTGILAGLGASLLSTDIVAKPLSERIAKVGKSNQIVALYDFAKEPKS